MGEAIGFSQDIAISEEIDRAGIEAAIHHHYQAMWESLDQERKSASLRHSAISELEELLSSLGQSLVAADMLQPHAVRCDGDWRQTLAIAR
jgi:hypothetical protein